LLKHILLIFAGLIVYFWTLYLMVTSLKFALGIILFLITFIVGELLLSKDYVVSGTERRHDYSESIGGGAMWESGLVGVFVFSLIIIFLVPSMKGEIFIEWAALELPYVARMIAAFSLNFLPGYVILSIVGKPKLNRLPKLITSYLLSLFVLMITGFVSAKLSGLVNDFFLMAFLLVCIVLAVAYFLKRLLRKRVLDNPKTHGALPLSFKRVLPTLLVGLAIAFIGIWLLWMYSSIGFLIGAPGTDMWRQHGYAQTFLDYRAFLWINSPWWFNLYLACFIVLAGVPSANAYFALYPLIVLPVLSFHIMAFGFLKNKKMASLATLSYAIFSGPVWLYALYLRDFGPVSYDAWMPILYEAADKFLNQGRYPPFLIGFTSTSVAYTSLWWIMYAIFQLDLREKFNFFLMTVTVAMSYLIHGVEPVIFIVYLAALLFVFLFTRNDKGKKQVRFAALSVIAALAMVSVIELSLTPQYDYFHSFTRSFAHLFMIQMGRYYYLGSSSFSLLALTSSLIFVTTYIKAIETKLMRLNQLVSEKLAPKYSSSLKRNFVEIIFYLYGVALIVWLLLYPSFSTAAFEGAVPWYLYPVAGGVPFLFGLMGVSILVLRWGSIERKVRDILAFTAIAMILLFFFGQGVSFVNERFFYTGFRERRTLSYIHPMMSILMAYALVTLLGRGHKKKGVSVKYLARIGIISFLTSLIVLSSVSSTLIAGDFAFRGYFGNRVSEEELEALTYLHYSLPRGYNTGYLARYSGYYYIRNLASDKWVPDPRLWLGHYYYSPRSVISAIREADIKLLYLNHMRDSRDLKKNLFIQQLIKVLPVEFNNSEVTIYSIPPLQYPSQEASLRLVSLEEEEGSAMYDAYVLWSLTLTMSEDPYGIISNISDPASLDGAKSILVPSDPLPIESDVVQLLEWVSNGGHLILSNTNPYGMFSKLVGLVSKVPLVNCDSTEDWKTLKMRGEILIENAVKIEGNSSLRLKNDQSSWENWIYTPPTPWNLSGYEYLGIWVYGTGGGPKWLLYLTDSNNTENYFRYDLSVFNYKTKTWVANFTGWKLHLIPIKKYFGNLDLSAIKKLRILTGDLQPVNILIDDIFLLEEIGIEHSIIKTDGIQGTISIDLPIIEVEDLNSSAEVRVIANYTLNGVPVAPFAIQKDLGSGKVTYLNANLLYQSILYGTSGFSSPYEVLLKILETIGVE
jgi:hypothetical protein